MKKYLIMPILLMLLSTLGCKKFLDRKPLDSSTASTFLSTLEEMEIGLNGVYASNTWVFPNNTPMLFAIEATTDFAMKRGGNAEDVIALGQGQFNINNAVPNSAWAQAYKLVQRANQQIAGMENGRANVSPIVFGRVKAETLVLRAWAYLNLMTWFGNVPYYTKPPEVSEVLAKTRTPVATIVADLYKDMDEAAAAFDAATSQPVLQMGRVNKAVALGVKAKLALLIKDYTTAAAATNTIITSGNYGLNPRYTDLFMLAGQTSNVNKEILFNQTYPTDVLDPQNWMVVLSIPRQSTTSQSSHFPSQALVDRFEGKDGKRIDDVTGIYNPANPRINRDNRLRWTAYMPDDTLLYNVQKTVSLPYIQPKEKTIFNIYTNVRKKFNWNTGVFDNVAGGNNDWIGAQAAGIQWQVSATGNIGGVGYVWKKYVDSTQYSWETKTGYILMRYAEILLSYAEAKIELNQIDATVVNAINLVRARVGQPAIALGSQTQMRTIVRREREVEFGGEGLRLFDLRRWDIYAAANSGPVVGAALDPLVVPPTPVFNADGIPTYTTTARINFRNQVRNNVDPKFKLWPIPQFEIDVNPALLPNNPGW
jgi:starch-binding outer membrane protein, SusD/RagB family